MRTTRYYFIFSILICNFFILNQASASTSESEDFKPKPLDGVMIESVETYPNPQTHQFGIGIGLYPNDPYYTGLLISANYTYHFNPILSWEVANVSYAYSVQNSLTTELAEKYNVNPKKIKRLEFLLSSDFLYNIVNGKFVLAKEFIRYFKIDALGGIGLVNSNLSSDIAGLAGLRFEILTHGNFSWRFDIRDAMTVTNGNNYITLTLGLGISL